MRAVPFSRVLQGHLFAGRHPEPHLAPGRLPKRIRPSTPALFLLLQPLFPARTRAKAGRTVAGADSPPPRGGQNIGGAWGGQGAVPEEGKAGSAGGALAGSNLNGTEFPDGVGEGRSREGQLAGSLEDKTGETVTPELALPGPLRGQGCLHQQGASHPPQLSPPPLDAGPHHAHLFLPGHKPAHCCYLSTYP